MIHSHRIRAAFLVIPVAATWSAAAIAATPTFSLEAAAINGQPLPGGNAASVTAAPGDVITARIYVRDFSPNSERLRAYQAEMDVAGFSTGSAGIIQPVDFEAAKAEQLENKDNAFIDDQDPMYVHHGLRTIPLTDTRNAPGYRWLTVLLDPTTAPVHPQDGTKFYCGTVRLQVSADAAGTFTLRFVEDPQVTGLLNEENRQIAPIDYEPLTVAVGEGVAHPRVALIDPPDGAIDARAIGVNGDRGWTRLVFDAVSGTSDIPAGEFALADGTDTTPKPGDVRVAGTRITVRLDQAIAVGRWTHITFRPTGQSFRIGRLVGDVTGDGQANRADLFALLDAMSASAPPPLYRTDINADGLLDAADINALIDLVAPGSKQPAEARRIR